MSKCIGKTAAFNDSIMQAMAMSPGDDWSVELLEVDTDAYRAEAIKVMSVREIVMDEEAKHYASFGMLSKQITDYTTYLPLLAKRISELEIEVRA
jgi:hypothetical protein